MFLIVIRRSSEEVMASLDSKDPIPSLCRNGGNLIKQRHTTKKLGYCGGPKQPLKPQKPPP